GQRSEGGILRDECTVWSDRNDDGIAESRTQGEQCHPAVRKRPAADLNRSLERGRWKCLGRAGGKILPSGQTGYPQNRQNRGRQLAKGIARNDFSTSRSWSRGSSAAGFALVGLK